MGTILETREIKVHGHKYSTTGVFGHKGKKKKGKPTRWVHQIDIPMGTRLGPNQMLALRK